MSGPSGPRQSLDDIGLCLVFFTRLRLPSSDFGGRGLADAIWAAPFAGLGVAVMGALVYTVVFTAGLAAGPATALALAATMLITGCLHEDGLSDVADGFGGGRTPDGKLEIMRDSRIGAYGAAAIGVSLLIRWSALSQLAGPGHVFLALLAAHAASRGLFGAFMYFLPPARSDGLSANAGSVTKETATIGAVLGAVALLALGLGGAIAALVVLVALFAAFRLLCLRQIGGQTGDTIGAIQQLGEMAVLLVASVCLS